jgi:hypothetical protein
MLERTGDNSEVIQFVCGGCQISLTVDQSLAGVTGPCPSCGRDVTAPSPVAPSPVVPQGIVIRPRAVKKRGGMTGEAPVVAHSSGQRRSSSSRGRIAVRPDTGLSESHQEKVEIAAIVKMLIAGALALVVVLVVGYLLKSQFYNL